MKKHIIGFNTHSENNENRAEERIIPQTVASEPRKSIVRVYFPDRNMTLSYYNDMFDLHKGDTVYVDGKLESLQGQVVDVNYSFKIKLSDYKKVIAVIDTTVIGDIYFAGSHMITFDKNTMPYDKVKNWFFIPGEINDEEYIVGEDDASSFPLDDLGAMKISSEIAERGHDYYMQNRVLYISLDGTCGKAIIDGSEYYEVEFTYIDGNISNLVCSCYCTYNCKHEFATMLQLKECLNVIEDKYSKNYNGYFATITKTDFVNKIFSNKNDGKITLG